MLIYHDTVIAERFEAASVELLGEESLARTERIGGIHDYNVILVCTSADKLHAVLVVYVNSRIVETAGCSGQVLLADLHNKLVYLHKVYALNRGIARKLADNAAVACADDKYILGIRVYSHRHMSYHLMVDELVLLRQHHVAVESEEPPELLRIENVDTLELAVAAVELMIDLY